jgi:hypothetical protein
MNNPSEQDPKNTFNPNDHLIQLRSREGAKDYLPVQWRLVWFREQCPQGTIMTEEVVVDLDREVEEEAFVWNNQTRKSDKVMKHARGYARFKAIVTDGKGGSATGTKSENAASFPDYIEKAETGAIGRALAALGYGTQFAPEMDEAHRIVDSPVEPRQSNGTNNATPAPTGGRPSVNNVRPLSTNANANTQQPASTGNITEQQLASIRKLSEHLGKAVPDFATSLDFEGGKKLIQSLTTEYRESRQNGKSA